ncbi:uncharacterized protein MELLADRAFT_102755 [Melampsora larici-populina 98AG31]|uniref:Uncharacterized protein n=1 Tax=Melampsora larici-populina (strain 98AG31 / pathotype 3-4-7) TaxID=747676 RepID=F4R9A0_MELLP|nr:uncharacterized protein MELLADRAFT_102755 [Melampsora larici-populina 98AG31]EGG10949.1 hypothetical protein MELLADRAFT_102755 [Melampsora larici-populina 98AG31]
MRSIIPVLVCICVQHGAIINGLPNHSYDRLVSPSLQRRMHDLETIKEATPALEYETHRSENPGNGRFPVDEIEEIEPALKAKEPWEPLAGRVIDGKDIKKNKAKKISQDDSFRVTDPDSSLTPLEIQYGKEWEKKKFDVNQMLRLHDRLQLPSDGVSSINFPPTRLIKDSNDIEDSKTNFKLEPLLDDGIDSKTGEPKKFTKDQLKWYLKHFKVTKHNDFEKEEFQLNLKHYIGQTWNPNELKSVEGEGKPKWILEKYVKEWKKLNLDETKMMNLGGLLGIHFDLDHVELISKESAFYLRGFLRKSESSKEMLNWYKEAILPSLSTLSQKILNINLKYSEKEPWWSRVNSNTWQWYDRETFSGDQLFQLSIVQIGEILRLGERNLEPTIEEIKTMKSDLLGIFKRVPYMIVEPSTRETHGYPTIIADELDAITHRIIGESLFSERMQSIGLTNEEKLTFSNKFFDSHVTDQELMSPVIDSLEIQWLIHGWSPTDAYEVTSNLRKLLAKSNISLLKNLKKSSKLLNSISPESWIKNGKLSTQSFDLLEFYSKLLNKPEIMKKLFGKELSLWLRELEVRIVLLVILLIYKTCITSIRY